MTTKEVILDEVRQLKKRDKLVVVSIASALLQSQKVVEKKETKKDRKAA